MALEINTLQCRGCRGGAHRYRVVETRLLKVVGLPVLADGAPLWHSGFGGD